MLFERTLFKAQTGESYWAAIDDRTRIKYFFDGITRIHKGSMYFMTLKSIC